MFKTIRNAWSIPDLRRKILFTLLIIVVFRIGSVIPVPFLDTTALAEAMKLITDNPDTSTNMLAYLNTLSGGAFANATLFAMGITPYADHLRYIMGRACTANLCSRCQTEIRLRFCDFSLFRVYDRLVCA